MGRQIRIGLLLLKQHISADKSPRSPRTVVGGPLHLCLEEVNDIVSSHPLEGVPVPAPLYRVPHAIRDFRVIRPCRSVVLEHREDYRSFDFPGERHASGKDLEPAPAVEYRLEIERHAEDQLTSQASMPNANISVAFVARAWTNPNVCGLMSSGASPQNSLSAAVSDQLAGSVRENADPKPPKQAMPSLPTSIFRLEGMNIPWPRMKGDDVPS